MSFLKVEDLKIHYPVRKKGFLGKPSAFVKAVDGVSIEIEQGSVVGVVGESGCGKSTLAKAIMGLVPVTDGKIHLMDQEMTAMSSSKLRKFRKNFQMVFQDPEASLNPRLTVGELIAEPITVHQPEMGKDELLRTVQALMKQVGLNPYMIRRYPHEFSGGQRQRICIARALSVNPSLVVCDEAVSALDVSIQAQIVNLLNDLKKKRNLTYLFISHDLAVTRYISDHIVVMYLGKVVEMGTTDEIMNNPKHPYTQALISAVPQYKREEKPIELVGEIPSPMNPPPGCRFHTRCWKKFEPCSKQIPNLIPLASDRSSDKSADQSSDQQDKRQVSCHLYS